MIEDMQLRGLPAPPRRAKTYRVLTIVAVIFGLGFLPAIIWQVVLAVRHLAAFLASS